MHYHLDTNIIVFALRRRDSTHIANRFRRIHPDNIKISLHVWAELQVGVEKSSDPALARKITDAFLSPFEILYPDLAVAREYALLRAQLESAGTTIGANDYWIAAQALSRNAVLVTHNIKEFHRVPHLKCEDWVRNLP